MKFSYRILKIASTRTLISVALSVFTLPALAGYGLTIEPGPASQETKIDMEKGIVTVNFKYQGCDPSPDFSLQGQKLVPKLSCRNGQDYSYAKNNSLGEERPYFGQTGQIQFDYKSDADKNCSPEQMKTKRQRMTFQVKNINTGFKRINCEPVGLLLTDTPLGGDKAEEASALHAYQNKGNTCKIEPKEITLPGFRTDDSKMTKLKVADNEFSFGDNTFYRYDAKNKRWHARYVATNPKDKKCYPTKEKPHGCSYPSLKISGPIPIMHSKVDGNGQKNVFLAATVKLNMDGTVKIVSHKGNKAYKSNSEVFASQPYAEDDSKGHIEIDMNPLRKGVSQTKVTSFLNKKGPKGRKTVVPIRTLNIVGRDLLGANNRMSWCGTENCFRRDVESENLCSNRKGPIDMSKGGSDNVCYSCLGITAGMCSAGSEQKLTAHRDQFDAAQKAKLTSAGNPVPLLPGKKVDAFASLFKQITREAKGRNKMACKTGKAPNVKSQLDAPAKPAPSQNMESQHPAH